MKWLVSVIGWLAAASCVIAADEANEFPYQEFFRIMAPVKGEVVDGVELIPVYLKPILNTSKIDVTKADFRIRMADGKTVPLRCEELPEKPADAKTQEDHTKVRQGFTHKLWIPKDPAKYGQSVLLNNLPPGSLDMHLPAPKASAHSPAGPEE